MQHTIETEAESRADQASCNLKKSPRNNPDSTAERCRGDGVAAGSGAEDRASWCLTAEVQDSTATSKQPDVHSCTCPVPHPDVLPCTCPVPHPGVLPSTCPVPHLCSGPDQLLIWPDICAVTWDTLYAEDTCWKLPVSEEHQSLCKNDTGAPRSSQCPGCFHSCLLQKQHPYPCEVSSVHSMSEAPVPVPCQ